MNLSTAHMVPIDSISMRDAPLCYYARVYLDNEYQQYCISASAKHGVIRRAKQITRGTYDPFGRLVYEERVMKLTPHGIEEMETIHGDVKIYAPNLCGGYGHKTSSSKIHQ